MVRAFVGITLPEDVKRYAVNIQKQLESLPIKSKLVEPENLHISLSFLGDVESNELAKIKASLDRISGVYPSFEIIIGSILLIPSEKFTRVIAFDVKSDVLESIRKEVVETMDGKSNPAHLTLARVKTIENRLDFIEGVNKIDYKDVSAKVDSISLIESELTRSGPVYTVLHKSYFK